VSGVIGHIPNPTLHDAVGLARAAEQSGASWIGLADAFWWRDVWMLLSAVAAETTRIEIGPAMTNPYLRHPFHTVSALATLHEAAPGRVFCGVAAGGSEVTAAAHLSRTDAAQRSTELIELIRTVAAGRPLDQSSGRGLDVALPATPVTMAGRGDAMLSAAGSSADRVLLWAMPRSDLQRSVAIVTAAATEAGRSPRLIWAPLVRHPDVAVGSLAHIAVYAALNSAAQVRRSWGLHAADIEAIRAALVAGALEDAIAMVPEAAFDDLFVEPGAVNAIAAQARDLGVTEIAVPGFAVSTLGGHLKWALDVEAHL
jgi:5,10-methylenetetrahydromethanopterin reductase